MPIEKAIYLDHNATTPVDPGVEKAMIRCMESFPGNPSSRYPSGVAALEELEIQRSNVAGLIGCAPSEIVFTSGGTESNNTVIKGLVDFGRPRACHIITSAVEHPAVLNPAIFLAELGVGLSVVQVDESGRVDPEAVVNEIRPETVLISIMLANNETGALQPIRDISRIASEQGVPLHADAAQAVGKIPVDVNDLGVDFLTIAGHKLYAPKGVGALFVREGRRLTPLMHGAAQEGGRRAGTESVLLATGLGEACRIARQRLGRDTPGTKDMRDHLQKLLFEGIEDLVLHGPLEERLPNTLFVSVPGIEGNRILEGIPEIQASTGAACHDRSVSLSHVLAAMRVPPEVGMGALRLTVGRTNDMDQMEAAARLLIRRIRELRSGR